MLLKYFFTLFILNLAWLQIQAQSNFQNITIWALGYINEPTICINPKNVNQMVGGANNNRFFYSNNGGLTWSTGTLSSPWGVWGDPVIIVDTSNTFYFFHLSYPPSPGWWIDRMVCQKSTNGGQSWTSGTYFGLNTYPKRQDKEWAVVNRTNNNIYVTWTEFDNYGTSNTLDSTRILFTKSTDLGLTWSNPVRISRRAGDCIDSDNTVEGAVPAVGPNGQIYVSWAGPLGLMFNRSLDEGETWVNANIFVSDFPGGWDYAIPGINRANGLPVTCCDLSSSPYNGYVYINWSDQRNGASDTDVWFIKSTDQGTTWQPKVRVNNDPPGKHQFFTWMTVDQVTGYIYIVFYDRRNYSDTQTDVYMAVSTDGGTTFENMRISQAPFIPNNCPTGSNFFGDYTNIAAHNNIVRPIWATCDNSTQSIKLAIIDNLFSIPAAPAVNVVNNCGSSTLTASNYTGTLLWSTGATTTSITVTSAGSYTVTQTVNGFTSPAGSGTAAPKTLPVPSTTANSPVVMGSTISLTSLPNGMSSYAWSGPNGFTSSLQNPSISNANAGNAGAYAVTVTSSNSCSAISSSLVIMSLSGGPYYTISGALEYNNASNTPLNLVTLGIAETGGTSTTNSGGNYSFPYLSAGTYTLGVVAINKPPGDINSTDAALANYWSANQSPVEHVKFLSGDVSDNYAINATDALKIQNYFVYGTPFDRHLNSGSPWVFWKAGDLVLNNNDPNASLTELRILCNGNLTVDMLGQVIGDYGGSYTPTPLEKTFGSAIRMVHSESIHAAAGTMVDLPVRIMPPSTLAAISLILNFPSEFMEVTGVTMKGSNGDLAWSVRDNKLRIGWNSIFPMEIGFNDEPLTIHLKTSNEFTQGDVIFIELESDPLNELADGNLAVITDVVLEVNAIEYSSYGINETSLPATLALTCRPNPFHDFSTLSYYLPAGGYVSLQLNDIVGHKVIRLVDEFQGKGPHSVTIDMKKLVPGLYMASIILRNNEGELKKTIMVVRNRQ
jgi:hypothetical protein